MLRVLYEPTKMERGLYKGTKSILKEIQNRGICCTMRLILLYIIMSIEYL